jgi:hypothetical protein
MGIGVIEGNQKSIHTYDAPDKSVAQLKVWISSGEKHDWQQEET